MCPTLKPELFAALHRESVSSCRFTPTTLASRIHTLDQLRSIGKRKMTLSPVHHHPLPGLAYPLWVPPVLFSKDLCTFSSPTVFRLGELLLVCVCLWGGGWGCFPSVSLAPELPTRKAVMAEGSLLVTWQKTPESLKSMLVPHHLGSVVLKRLAPVCHLQSVLFRRSWGRPRIGIFYEVFILIPVL